MHSKNAATDAAYKGDRCCSRIGVIAHEQKNAVKYVRGGMV